MSDTLRAAGRLEWGQGDYVVRAEPASTIAVLPHHESATDSLYRMAKNAMLPLLCLASFGTPAVPGVRRVFSDATISRSAIGGQRWLLVVDAFHFTEEPADADEVRALNALLQLPTATGLELNLPD
jgi:hypothetical protein